MIFSSLLFIYIFLPVNILLYFIFRNSIYRNFILILFSLLFYAWGQPAWVLILVFTATADYFHGRIIGSSTKKIWIRLTLTSSLLMNIGLLVIFKYQSFLIDTMNAIIHTDFIVSKFVFPLGISFYIFRSLSYIIDVYRKNIPSEKYYHNYLMYLSLYPCLIAGPIVRYSEISEEIATRKTSIADISRGISRFCLGLFKKVFFADMAGELASKFLTADLTQASMLSCWAGIILFALQIFFDFSGYSDMAIGLGRIFGFHFNENFNFPYISRSITEFWRRWHISLSTWLRDYIFIPFSLFMAHRMKRKKYFLVKSKYWVNIFSITLTFFICGFWHGPGWNFILWGVYFAFFMILESVFLSKILNYRYNFLSHLYFLLVILFSWVIFYFTDIAQILQFSKVLMNLTGNPVTDLHSEIIIANNIYWFLLAILFCLPIKKWVLQSIKSFSLEESSVYLLAETMANVGLIIISTSMLVGKSYIPFLYFQF